MQAIVRLVVLGAVAVSIWVAPTQAFTEDREVFVKVSIIQLIARPQDFDGMRVVFTGFVDLSFEGTAVYLGEEDSKVPIPMNGIWLRSLPTKDLQREVIDKQYCMVKGTFVASERGHFGLFAGGIDAVAVFPRKRPAPTPQPKTGSDTDR